MTTIVAAQPEHYAAIRQLTIAAFTASELGYGGEADLIDAICAQCPAALSLVALDEGQVVGHILFSPATIRSESATVQGMALAPMAVLPARQRCGIGSLLVTEGLRRLDATSAHFIIVAGHAEYYPRFGFLPARDFSLTHGFAGMPQDILFLRTHPRSEMPPLHGGRAYFDAAFGPQHVG